MLGILLTSAQAGTFKNPRLIATNSDPIGVAAADFNQDGKTDIVYIDGTNYYVHVLHVLLGNGNGTFSHGQDLNLPYGTCGNRCQINVADVTKDGKLDLILGGAGSSSASIIVLLGNGDGTFQQPLVTSFSYGGNYPSLTQRIGVGDVNGDGAIDLVVPDAANYRADILLGNNTGHFSLSAAGSARGPTYLQDLNADGRLDILSFDLMGSAVVVNLGNGDGSFQASVRYLSPGNGILADLDGDGHPDVVCTNAYGQIVVLKGKADGTFAASAVAGATGVPVTVVAAGDYNQDGIADLFVLSPAGVGILLGTGNLTYGPMQSFLAGNAIPNTVAVADYNGDGHPDLVVGTAGGIALLDGRADGSFVSGGDLYDIGQLVGTVAVADFNGDQMPDIAVTLPAAVPRLLLGSGGGKFTLGADPNASYTFQVSSLLMSVGDFNGDGNADVVVSVSNNSTVFGMNTVFLGTGSGAFSAPISVPAGTTTVADVNHDGRTDMISIGSTIAVSLGTADTTFPQVTTPLRNALYPGLVGIGDINHDGKLDLIVSSSDGYSGTLMELWIGNGDGSFTYNNTLFTPPAGQAQASALADLDGDGNFDLISVRQANNTASFAVSYGNSDGTVQAPVVSPLSRLYKRLAIADVNQDHRPDLVLDDGSAIGVILNLGNRNFDQEVHYVAGAVIGGLVVADVNGDGFPDIVAADANGTTVAVLLNDPTGSPPGGESISKTISISPEPSDYGQSFFISIATSAPSAGSPVPTGLVGVTVDGSFLGTAALQAGSATYTVNSASAGAHAIVLSYSGDSFYRAASFSVQHYVNQPVFATHTALVATPTSIYASQTVSLIATVTSPGSPLKPLGIVTFYDGTGILGSRIFNFISTGPADNSLAVLDTALLKPGTHSISAVFNGYSIHNGTYWETLAPSKSDPVIVTVTSIPTTVAITASSMTPTAGAVETLTATVSSPSNIPFGSVTFYDSGAPPATVSLKADGSATYSVAYPGAGKHNIAATFNANASFAGSSSSMLTVSVGASNLAQTVTSLRPVHEGAQSGTLVLSASVYADNGIPDGSVTFLDGGTILGTVALDAGRASLPVGSLDGAHSLWASFGGNDRFAPSVSPELQDSEAPAGPEFSLFVDAEHVAIRAGSSAGLNVTVIPIRNFQSRVELSCDGLPSGFECTYTPASLEGGGTAHLSVTTSATAQVAAAQSRHSPWSALGRSALFGFGAALFLVGIRPRRRAWLLLACTFLALMPGCGQSIAPERAGVNVVVLTIHASSSAGTILHSAQVFLRVTPSR